VPSGPSQCKNKTPGSNFQKYIVYKKQSYSRSDYQTCDDHVGIPVMIIEVCRIEVSVNDDGTHIDGLKCGT